MEFNKHAKNARTDAEKYCKLWKMDVDKRSKELNDLVRANKMDPKTFNQKRLALNNEVKDLNKCVDLLNKA
jgi:hypothetical protein